MLLHVLWVLSGFRVFNLGGQGALSLKLHSVFSIPVLYHTAKLLQLLFDEDLVLLRSVLCAALLAFATCYNLLREAWGKHELPSTQAERHTYFFISSFLYILLCLSSALKCAGQAVWMW